MDLDNYVPYPATWYFISSFNCCVQGCRSRHIIIIIRQELGLYRNVPASTNSLHFNGLPSHLHLFRLYFNIIFGILLLFILAKCRSQFDLYLRSFSSTASTFNSSKISSFLLWSKREHQSVLLKNLILIYVNRFL